MAITYQFNRVEIQSLRRQLKVRQVALPTLKSKESVLRAAVVKQKDLIEHLQLDYDKARAELETTIRLWPEFPPDILSIGNVKTRVSKIAGIQVPELESIEWNARDFSRFNKPIWLPIGVRQLRELGRVSALIAIAKTVIHVLEQARRKTTQKVNLYEKVQIPGFNEAILRIKRYLEDVENLEKAAQKLTKERLAAGGGS